MPDLNDGERRMVTSSSGRSYQIYNSGGAYSCSCPAWRNQGLPIDQRTCKHLRTFRGSSVEQARINAAALSAAGVRPGATLGRTAPVTTPLRTLAGTTPAAPARGPLPSKPTLPAVPAKNAWNRLLGEDPFGDDPPPPVIAPEPTVLVTGEEAESTFAVLLAQTWDNSVDPTGYLMSEKLDGVRAYWDGTCFRSRLDNVFRVPDWYTEFMPKGMHLDGEFWMGRGRFQETSGFVRRHDMGDYWHRIQFRAFDIPSAEKEPFTKRYDMLRAVTEKWGEVKLVEHQVCRGVAHLKSYLAEIEREGGEGVMLRQPGSLYVRTRSDTLLKVKTFYDAEAEVVGHTHGRGKHKGTVGALECSSFRFFNGKVALGAGVLFKVGTGLSDADRRNPPPVGTIITFRFQELTRDGVPRFPSYVGRRDYE